LRADHREELESLEAEANNAIEFRDFVPVDKLDPVILRAAITLRPRKARKNRIDSLPRRSKKPAALP